MRTHYLDTRCRIKSFVVKVSDQPMGVKCYAPFIVGGRIEKDEYQLSGSLMQPDGRISHVRYSRVTP